MDKPLSKQHWQWLVEELMEAKQKPVLRYRCFAQINEWLINNTNGYGDNSRLRDPPSPPLHRVVIQPYVNLHGKADFFWAGELNTDIMKKNGPLVFIEQKDAEKKIISEGRKLAEKLINSAMEKITDELASFCNKIHDTHEIPFDVVQNKYCDLAAKTHFDIQKNPDGANLVLPPDQLSKLYFEDILDWLIYITPMFVGQGKLWLKGMNCESCGKFFFYERSTAKFCSDACRMAAAYKTRRSK